MGVLKMNKFKNINLYILISLFCFGIMVSGCATTEPTPDTQSPVKIAYATIKSSAIAYDSVMSAIKDLDAQGKITDEQQAKIIEFGNKFWIAYHTSVDALIAYKKSGGDGINLESALSTLISALNSFLDYSTQITK